MKFEKYFLMTAIILLFFQSVWAQPTNEVLDGIIAKVDNEIILKSDLDKAYTQLVIEVPEEARGDEDELMCQVLEGLVMNKLMVAKAEIDSVVIEPGLVENQLERRIDYILSQFNYDEAQLAAIYGKTVDQLRSELRPQIKEQMLIQQMQQNIIDNIKITPKEVKNFYDKLPKDSLFLPRMIEVAHIVVEPEAGKKQKEITKQKLQEIQSAIENGQIEFAKAADSLSQDRGSAIRGGDLGWHQRGELVPGFESAIFRMNEGEFRISESQFGFHLIQLIERRGNEYNSRHILLKPRSSGSEKEIAENLLDSIRTAIVDDSITFAAAAREFSVDKFTANNGGEITSDVTGTTEIPYENLESPIFFAIDEKRVKLGEISEPMPYRTDTGKDAYRIFKFISDTPKHKATLEQDYDYIQNLALNDKINHAIQEWFLKSKKDVYISLVDEYQGCSILNSLK